MERLTYFENGHWRLDFNGCQYQAGFVDRLAAYEDTGLTPDEIKSMQGEHFSGLEMAKLHSALMELKKYQAADNDGRVVVLPCKVGDTVYKVITIQAQKPVMLETQVKTLGQAADISQLIGKKNKVINIFLTREEAERALQEMEGKA